MQPWPQGLKFALQVKPQVFCAQVAEALAGGVQSAGEQHWELAMQPWPQGFQPMPQVKPQALPSQVAVALAGVVHDEHVAPQAITSLARQKPSGHARWPVGQPPAHDMASSMQAPWQIFFPAGQAG
jgi:hypothetical protein